MSVEELEAAVTRLSDEERSRFAAWIGDLVSADAVFVDSLALRLASRRREDALARAFGVWGANDTDFDTLRASADHR